MSADEIRSEIIATLDRLLQLAADHNDIDGKQTAYHLADLFDVAERERRAASLDS